MDRNELLQNLLEPILGPIIERLAVLEEERKPQSQDRWLTRKEAAKYIPASPSSIDRWAQQGRLTKHRIGGVVRYDRNEIDQRFDLQKGTKITSNSK
jgi:excisionase family DNA binding protein